MCGIAGVLSVGRIDTADTRRMADALIHRGPDDCGIWTDPDAGVAMVHRRLSIMDLSVHGHQPMASANGRLIICYNGEIYNHVELRRELDQAGATPPGGWRGHSDTETLLEAIAHWGLTSTLSRATGMFAFALWDVRERRLYLARDRFGEKPLYYGWAGTSFLFASELKAMRTHPRFDAAVDRTALATYAARTYVPAPLSIYRRIYKLEPGCVLSLTRDAASRPRDVPPRVGANDGGLSLGRYWSYRDTLQSGLANPIENEAEAIDALESALAKAIRDQSIADVPVGAFLSGGIDSAAVVALYRHYSGNPIRTFTIGFAESAFDEAPYARAVARHLDTIHHEHVVSVREAQDVIPLLPHIYDEPFADSSQIPTCIVSRVARGEVTVALTGDGGDELFGGYNRHVMAPAMWRRLQSVPRPLRALGAPLARIPASFWQRGAQMLPGRRQPHIGAKLRKAFALAADARSLDDVYLGFLDEWRNGSPVRGAGEMPGFDMDAGPGAPDALRMMYCDAVSYLPDDILCKVDRASMAVSLETRVPFLDPHVAAVSARIPLDMKLRNGQGKHVLRELLYRHVPRHLFDRPKAGFAVPVGEWIRGPLRPWAEELLDPAAMASDGWFDPVPVQQCWRGHLSGRLSATPALWGVLMFQAWLRAQRVRS